MTLSAHCPWPWSSLTVVSVDFLTYLFEHGRVGRQVWVAGLAVEVDDEFEFEDGLYEMAVRSVDHRNVVSGDGFAGPGAPLPRDGQGLLEVGQRLLPVTEPVVDGADVAHGDGFAGPVADLPPD